MAVRFDHFMEAALYDPGHGYYTSRIRTVGTRGDFSTTATLSACLARAVARQFVASGERHLIELGPGDGSLAAAVWKFLPPWKRFFSRLHLVEISPALRSQQARKIPSAHSYPSITDALSNCAGRAFIYSNEFVDAFPVRIFRREESSYSELFVQKRNNHIHEVWHPAKDLPDSTYFHSQVPPGHRFEVHESYHLWLKSWRSQWHAGQMLTIDYGGSTQEILSSSPQGTLRAYHLQQRLTGSDALQNPGHQDLTCDVSFDDLALWGQSLKLSTLLHTTQREFLTPVLSKKAVDNFLVDSEGAGAAFKVLIQNRQNPQTM